MPLNQVAFGMAKAMRPMFAQLLFFELAILFQARDEVSLVRSNLFEQLFGAIPAIHHHVIRLQPHTFGPAQESGRPCARA